MVVSSDSTATDVDETSSGDYSQTTPVEPSYVYENLDEYDFEEIVIYSQGSFGDGPKDYWYFNKMFEKAV